MKIMKCLSITNIKVGFYDGSTSDFDKTLYRQCLRRTYIENRTKNLKWPFIFQILTFELWSLFARGWCVWTTITSFIMNVFLKLKCRKKGYIFFFNMVSNKIGFVIYLCIINWKYFIFLYKKWLLYNIFFCLHVKFVMFQTVFVQFIFKKKLLR